MATHPANPDYSRYADPERLRPFGQRATRRLGTLGHPAKIIHAGPVQILIPQTDEHGHVTWKMSEASLQGMIAIDEPTLEFYQQLNSNAQQLGNP